MVVVIGLIYKKPLTTFFEKIYLLNIKGGGLEISATGAAKSQQEAKDATSRDPLNQIAQPQAVLALPEDIAKRRELVKNYGGNSPLVTNEIQNLKNDLNTLQFPLDSAETAETLIRHLAVTQLLQRAEFLYRTIFGSQIQAMRVMNTEGPQSDGVIRAFYETARTAAPKFYGEYTFEQWIDFLIRNRVVVVENGRYEITPYGREFLSFLVGQGLPDKAN
jgi:hypothetical protein